MVRELLLPLHMKPTAKRFLRFFVTILLPTISNRWAFALIIRVILCCMYNMGQKLFARKFVARDYKFPIPKEEILRNPALGEQQNPGW